MSLADIAVVDKSATWTDVEWIDMASPVVDSRPRFRLLPGRVPFDFDEADEPAGTLVEGADEPEVI